MRRCFEKEEWSSKSDHEPTETERESRVCQDARHTVMTLYFDHNIGIFYLGFD